MTRNQYVLITFVLSLGFVTCSTIKDVTNETKRLTLERAEKIIPGTTTKMEILEWFGNPNYENDLSENPSLDDSAMTWLYTDEGESRLTIYYKKGSIVVGSVGWRVRNEERERELSVARERISSRFKSAIFQYRDKPWREDDRGFEAAYEDPKLGIVILVQKVTEKVTALTWSDPELFAQEERKWKNGSISCHHGNDCVWIDSKGKQTRTITSPDSIDAKR